MNFTSINIQGSVISLEMLDKIRQDSQIPYQKAKDFGLPKGVRLREHIGQAWSEARLQWSIFKTKRQHLPEGEYGTAQTRNAWMIPFLMNLGYYLENSPAEIVAGKSYAISHRDHRRDRFPVLIMSFKDMLDRKPAGQRLSMSPHGLTQDYLNQTDHLYALVSNGLQLRLLRDSSRLSRLAYLEFDLEKMMEEELYNEFALMYRVLHVSRMPQKRERADEAIFEQYHQDSLDAGARIRTKLRMAVKEAMEIMANGFIRQPENHVFREAVKNGEVNAAKFYRLMLRTMYRIIFLATIEERDLVFPPVKATQEGYEAWLHTKRMYFGYYSLERLRKLAMSPAYIDPRRTDLWYSLLTTFRLYEPLGKGEKIGIQPLGGTLFAADGLNDEVSLYELRLANEHCLNIIGKLTSFRNEAGGWVRVNYRDLDVEEFGSVYEALLELYPYFNINAAMPVFAFTEGSEQKLTGSYYTRHDLVAQLIKTSLMPVIRERLAAAATAPEKEQALLDIKIGDTSSGSGHFLIAAARALAFELAKVRSGEENPGERWMQHALRDVIQHCIYGVDKNPAAVELCRISLWLVGHNSGKPLTFLEHKIRQGDALIGLDRLDRLQHLIPNTAFKKRSGDSKDVVLNVRKLNRNFLKSKQFDLFQEENSWKQGQDKLAKRYVALNAISVESVDDYFTKQRKLDDLRKNPDLMFKERAANLFTYAFYQSYPAETVSEDYITSQDLALFLRNPKGISTQKLALADAASAEHHYFHWPLEFPDIAERGGFDVILTNPPWERIKLQEQEFFGPLDDEIAHAPNASARKKRINELRDNNPELWQAYREALHESESASRFIRDSGRYPLTGRGDINTYSIFSELIKEILHTKGRGGFVVPTGIATDDTNKYYFADLMEKGRLESLFDFENKKAIFEGVHRSYKFCLLTIGPVYKERKSRFGFFLHDVLDLQDERRVFELSKDDFLNINPNTKTAPIFRTRQDAELTAKIYSRVPVLVNEEKGQNPWGISFLRMFDMSNDSGLFRTEAQMRSAGFELMGNRFVKGQEIWLPLYEAKMLWFYDHSYRSYARSKSRTQTHNTSIDEYCKPELLSKPWYWISLINVEQQSKNEISIGFRNIARTTDARTLIISVLPFSGIGHSMPILISTANWLNKVNLLANLSSLIFDYLVRQKIGGVNMTFGYFKQFPVLPEVIHLSSQRLLIATLELIYTSWDIKAFADDLWREADKELRNAIEQQWEDNARETGGHEWNIPDWHTAYPEIEWEQEAGCPLPPFKWDEERRARLRAELDAHFALLYGLERDELRYILDPQDVHGADFPGETFRVLKNKEIREHGEYRTRRLILEAYDRMRPTWDMEAHLKKMKEVWEQQQVNLIKKQKAPSATAQLQDLPTPYGKEKPGQGDLF